MYKNIILVSALTGLGILNGAMGPARLGPNEFNIEFINNTGHDITVLAVYKDNRPVAPRSIGKERTIATPFAIYRQNLNDINEYKLSYTKGAREKLQTPLLLNAAELSHRAAGANAKELLISLEPTGPLGGIYTTGIKPRFLPRGKGELTTGATEVRPIEESELE